MQHIVAKFSNLLNKIPAQGYLLLAVIIFAASNSITRKLTEIGEANFIEGENPVSFCNVLFVGNICASIVLILIFRREWSLHALKQLSGRDWISLIGVALLSGALAPGVTFEALRSTMVTNVVFIGRIEPPLFLALSVWFLKERVNRWEIAGASVSFAGIIVSVLLQSLGGNMMHESGSLNIGKGEMLAALGAVALGTSSVISKSRLTKIPLGIFTVFRTVMGTVVFFCAALYFYGSHHFMDVFSPFLWQWMLVYGTVIVAVGQLSWFSGLKNSSGSDASLAGAFSPIAAILTAYLILGEKPNLGQYIGGSIILVGILLSQIGVWRKTSGATEDTKGSSIKEMGTGMGFKGI